MSRRKRMPTSWTRRSRWPRVTRQTCTWMAGWHGATRNMPRGWRRLSLTKKPMTCDRIHPRTGSAGGGALGASTGGGRLVRGWHGRWRRTCGGDPRGERPGRPLVCVRPRRLGAGRCGQALGQVWRSAGVASGTVCRLGQAPGQGELRRGSLGSRGELATARRGGARFQFSGRGAVGHADGSAAAGERRATGERVGGRGACDDFLGTGRRAPVAAYCPGDC